MRRTVVARKRADVGTEESDAPQETPRKWLVWACLLVGLYLAVGIFGWNRTLIPDEIVSLLLAAKPLREQLEYLRWDLVHAPLSFLFQRWWLGVFGQTDSAAKASALLLNIPTLVLFTWLASRVTTRWRLAAFLFSIPFLRIGGAVNLVRMYGLLLLLTVIVLVIWEQWRKRPSNGKLVALTAVVTVLVYTHYSAVLLLPVLVAMNWFYGPRRSAFAVAFVVPLLAFLPWIIYVVPFHQGRGLEANVFWVRQGTLVTLTELPFFFLSGEDAGGGTPTPLLHRTDLKSKLVPAAVFAHFALLALALRGIFRLRPLSQWRGDKVRWLLCAAMMCLVPVIALAVVSVVSSPVLHARYLLLSLPAYWLLVVLLGQLGGRAGMAVVMGVFAPWVLIGMGLIFEQNWKPSPYLRATAFLAREMVASDLILCDKHMPLGWQVYWEWTRRQRMNPAQVETLPSHVPPHLDAIVPAKPLEDLNLENVNRVWFLRSDESHVSGVSQFLAGRGFLLDKSVGAEIPSLLVFTRTRVAQTGLAIRPARLIAKWQRAISAFPPGGGLWMAGSLATGAKGKARVIDEGLICG